MQRDNLDLLRALEADETAARRRAMQTSVALVVAAAVILAGLLLSGYRELNAVRARTASVTARLDTLRADSTRLAARITELQRVEENYVERARADTLTPGRDDSQLVIAPDTLPSTGRDTAASTGIELPPRSNEPPSRVYLQIVTAGDRRYADSVGALLDRARFRVLGVEHVRDAPLLKNTELRYYKRVDEPEAQRLLRVLRASGEPDAVLLYLGLENSTRVRPRHYEIWFAAGVGRRGVSVARTP